MPLVEVYERETIRFELIEVAEPFNIEPACVNAEGHYYIASCGDVVCVHCSKVVWQ